MNALNIYFIILLVQLSILLYLKSNMEYFKVLSTTNYFNFIAKEDVENSHILPIKTNDVETLTINIDENEQLILSKSLRHLEFISTFEMYLEDKNSKNFPLEFLQEFEKIKIEAQLSALKTTNQLSNQVKKAA